jgi:hypothetical protein
MHPDEQEVAVDTETSPFSVPAIEGMPYDEGSEEDRAIEEVIREAEEERVEATRPEAHGFDTSST